MPNTESKHKWTGQWCWVGKHLLLPWNTYVYFRREVDLPATPRRAVVRVSADARYTLYVNGVRVHQGPARFHPEHPSYDTLDLAPLLRPGKNAICAIAHQFGVPTFIAQYRDQAGFLLDGEIDCGDATVPLHTPNGWLSLAAKGWKKTTVRRSLQLGFQEHFDAGEDPADWMLPDFVASADGGWKEPSYKLPMGAHPWLTMESRLVPLLADRVERFAKVISTYAGESGRGYKIVDDVYHLPMSEKRKKHPPLPDEDAMLQSNDATTTIAPPTDGDFIALTLDLETYRTGHFMLDIADAAGDEIIDVLYGERIDDKKFVHIWPPGGAESHLAAADRYRCRPGPQKWETFQYSGMQFATLIFRNVTKPLKVRFVGLRQVQTDVPDVGSFECSDKILNRIWNVSRETQRNCIFDSFVDCPLREQAQWWGDARVQARVTMTAFGDTTLLERGIRQVRQSQGSDGATHSHPPSDCPHWLPDFSLTWVDSVWDFYEYTGRKDVPQECMPAVHRVLEFFAKHEIKDGLVDRFDGFWLFLDWAGLFKGNVSSVLNLYYLRTLRTAAKLCKLTGDRKAVQYETKAAALAKTIEKHFFDPKTFQWNEGFDVEKNEPVAKLSQHAATLAILLDLQPDHHEELAKSVLLKASLKKRSDVTPASSFFHAYVIEALNKVGLRSDAVAVIRKRWKEMLDGGAVAFWEGFDGGQSRCHAWSAHPLYHLSEQVLGVQRLAPGWTKIRIAPAVCDLEFARGVVPTPFGLIKVEWEHGGDDVLAVRVDLPAGIKAEFVAPSGETRTLLAGPQEFSA